MLIDEVQPEVGQEWTMEGLVETIRSGATETAAQTRDRHIRLRIELSPNERSILSGGLLAHIRSGQRHPLRDPVPAG